MNKTRLNFRPRASLYLALPILAGTPPNAPMPADAGISSASGRIRRSGAPAPIPTPVRSLRSETAGFCSPRCPFLEHPRGSPIVHKVDSGLRHLRAFVLRRANGASCDSSSEHDHSPGSLPVADSGRDTGGLAALPPAPTPSSTHGLSPALRSRTCTTNPPARIEEGEKISGAAPSTFLIRSVAAWAGLLALVAPLARFFLALPRP